MLAPTPPTPQPLPQVRFWGCLREPPPPPPPRIFEVEFKKKCFGKSCDSGRAEQGQNYKTLVHNIAIDRILAFPFLLLISIIHNLF